MQILKKNILSIIVALLIMYLSLASSSTFDKVAIMNFPQMDKIVHFCMYFGLMSVIIFENYRTLKNNQKLFLTALIPLSYGILMEVLQGLITVTRYASIFDALFNATGILVSILLWIWIRPRLKEKIR